MVLGKFEPKFAKGTDLKKALAMGLDEAFTALEESFYDLTNEQFWGFPLADRHNIVTLAEHCLQCLDLYGCEVQGEELTFEPESRFDIFHYSPAELRPEMTGLPSVEEERRRVAAVRAATLRALKRTSIEELATPNMKSWWFQEHAEKVRADAYMRAIWHTLAHVRQIWFLRGLVDTTASGGWPQQHWA